MAPGKGFETAVPVRHEGAGSRSADFIRAIVAADRRTNKHGGRVATRFPPEPNGYLHIGHAKSIVLNFGIAQENPGGTCNLRFDDTNPETEELRYVDAIQDDVRWLGYDWNDRGYFASDYFERLYEQAEYLIKAGKAYVDSQSEEEIREHRGTVTRPGRASPYRTRTVEENLDLLRRMRAGEFPNGAHVLRAKIDMASPNMLMRDPLLYRIRHAQHYRRGNDWCIYPLYDFTHCLSDAFEGITHSLCTLEFKDNRELYDWVLDHADVPCHPQQIEFARLNLDYTVLSKRKLVRLVGEQHVDGWDDPRMPTIAGLRRRGVTPEAIRRFCELVGVAKVDSRVDMEKLEYCIRDDLNQRAPRVMCVLRPLRVVIENYPEDRVEQLDAPYYPHDVPKEGSRPVPFSRELFIERDDFMDRPPKGFHRLAPGREVRLRYAYFIKCVDVVKDPSTGDVTELRCTYDPETKGGSAPDGRKVKGTIHWVSADHAVPLEVRLYDRLFSLPDPDDVADGEDFTASMNPDSKVVLRDSRIEPSVASDPPGSRYQFERQGYFCSDSVDSKPGTLVFNRTVGLRDTWARLSARGGGRGRVGGKAAVRVAREEVEPTAAPRKTAPRRPATGPGALDRYARMGLAPDQAKVLAEEPVLARLFDDALALHGDAKTVASWVANELGRELGDRNLRSLPFGGAELAVLAKLVDTETITRPAARTVLGHMIRAGGDPASIVEREGLHQLSEPDDLVPVVDRVLAENGDKVDEYRKGRTGLLGFFVGQVMQATGGRAKPEAVKRLVQTKLS